MKAHFSPVLVNYFLAMFLAIPGFAAPQEGSTNPVRSKTDLPSESSLPGQSFQNLPDESSLPNQLSLSSATTEGHDSVIQADKELPAENDLPATWSGSETAIELPLTELPSTELPTTEPLPTESLPIDPLLQLANLENAQQLNLDQNHAWLTLKMGGPTAPLKALKFTGDSKHILAGGDDKALHIWSLVDDSSGTPIWTYASPVLWQVQRGTRGAIRAIDVNADQIAFGGVGASGLIGEIIVVNPADLRFQNSLFDIEHGPNAEISSLAIDEAGRISSLDIEGRIVTWNRDPLSGQWRMKSLRQPDYELFDPATAARLRGMRLGGGALATSQNGYLVYPEPVAPIRPEEPVPLWNLVRRSPDNDEKQVLQSAESHKGGVTSIGMSSDGNRIASTDFTTSGWVFLWDLASRQTAATFKVNAQVRTISMSRTGRLLMIGTANAGQDASGPAKVSIWQWGADGKFKSLASWEHEHDIQAGDISPNEKWIAYTTDSSIFVRPINALDGDATVLQGAVFQPVNAAFSERADDDYRILISSSDSTNSRKQLVFETQPPRLADLDKAEQDVWVKSNPFPDRWKLSVDDDGKGLIKWFVSIDGKRHCQIPVDNNTDGEITCECWVVDPQNTNLPQAIIVGTSKRDHLYVFRVVDSGEAQLIRQFRGHVAPVASVGVSCDKRFLLSSSRDGTVRIWKLEDALSDQTSKHANRWGADFQIDNEKLVVKSLIGDGPLYFRGVRPGDVINKLSWNNQEGTIQSLQNPQEMLDKLGTSDWRQIFIFEYSRHDNRQPDFILNAAWQPIASLVVGVDREWAYWSPYGYYDASFNGHKLFGWQVNRGIDSPPEFFRASEMKHELEKPELMENLLVAGNIEDAFLALNRQVPANLEDRVAAENRLRPRIEIQAPAANSLVSEGEARIEAVIELPSGIDLARPKAFANGVPATELKLESSADDGSRQRQVYSWKARLPNEKNIRVQVFAATQYGSADVAHVDVTRNVTESSMKPRLFLIGAGINQYDDGQIPQLEFAVNNVTAIKDVIASPDNRLYETEAALLTNQSVSRSLWSVATGSFLDRLRKEARPDDLLVVFLSGHGFRDRASEQYFYVTSATRHSDLLGRRYSDCISLEDFGKFSEIPCRKIVILDTCHSGAVQPLSQSNLKTIVRALENDLIFTLTASEGNEEAFESTEQQMSYFSATMLQALRGEADKQIHGGNENGSVDFSEVVRYVKEAVPRQINRLGHRQYPTAAPAELFGFAEIPMTSVGILQK